MKNGLAYLLPTLASAVFMTFGCHGTPQDNERAQENDSLVANVPDSALYGHLGEGTGMSCLELITDNGDTLVLDKTDEKSGTDGLILGEIANYTDRFSIMAYNDNQSIRIALNVRMLEQKWQSATDKKNGFCLNSDYTAKNLSEEQYQYTKWGLCNCRLVMFSKGGNTHGDSMRSDTLEILELTPDSMVLRHIRRNSPETFYHIQ